jgi:hypothetical protein
MIEAKILSSSSQGDFVFIPRIPMITNNPFEFKRVQFPLKLCFTMTINKAKAQGQTLKITGLDLTTSCFTHGQFYDACSRVSSENNLYVYCLCTSK